MSTAFAMMTRPQKDSKFLCAMNDPKQYSVREALPDNPEVVRLRKPNSDALRLMSKVLLKHLDGTRLKVGSHEAETDADPSCT
mmetsp:Transcript_34490/g.94959  ORF Transcript_34490/g.94959 Transcript_34490/m.94959 type:complete len:83 (+) Transcript_34490:1274-1522(+)